MTSSSTTTGSPWIYFVSGALLPSLAFLFLRQRQAAAAVNDNDNEDWETDEDDEDDEDMQGTKGGPSSEWGLQDAPYKMVLCVNQELGMGKGKIAAQCCHAAVACYQIAKKQCPRGLAAWERTGCAKIALKCPTQDMMEEIAVMALSKDIPVYLVEDAGRTQIAAGSRTVLGLGPAPVSAFQGVSDHLKLM
jgi:PTH2 family peptidyl-tRNA hydrolase